MRPMPQERIGRGVYVEQLRDHWRVRVRHERYDDGRQRYPFKTQDHEEAREFARRLAEKLEADPSERTVGDVLAAFERRYLPTVRKTTEELWRNVIDRHLRPLIGEVPLSGLSRERIFQLGAEALASTEPKRSAYMVKHMMTVLRRSLRWYWIEHDVATRCPADLVTPAWAALRVREHLQFQRRQAWSRAEAEVVLEESRRLGGPIHPLLLLALGTGMRLGELLGLQWRDVDWKAQRVTVRRSIDGKHREGAPKSGRGRLVAVPPQGMEALQALRREARSLRWVFGTRTGQVMGRKRLYAAFDKVLSAAKARGVPDGRTIHSARHTFASLALEAGQEPAWIAEQLGHHSADYTQRAYGHALERERDLSWAEFRSGA